MAELTKAQLQAVVDYINENAARLHGIPANEKKKIGPDLTDDDLINTRIQSGEIVVLADRGVFGSPKYVLDAAQVETFARTKKAVEKVTAEPAGKK